MPAGGLKNLGGRPVSRWIIREADSSSFFILEAGNKGKKGEWEKV